jgi:hypothetical protein
MFPDLDEFGRYLNRKYFLIHFMGKKNISVSFDQNEIEQAGKIFAGVLLIVFTILPVFFMIGLWPDRMPEPKEPQLYAGRLFHLQINPKGTLHLNIIMFLLVSLAGFMGSMIHLGSSFTNYVGSEKFRRSWILWYFVKPFSAAGVAVIFYLILKAGLLNFDGAGAANPFGIVILSALAGLFTDKATIKLEEIFTVIFKPKDERPDKIDENTIKITGIDPKKLLVDAENTITIKGDGLDKSPLYIKINDVNIAGAEIKADNILFKYKVPELLKAESVLTLSIIDNKGRILYSGTFELDGKAQPITENAKPANDEDNEILIDEESITDVVDFVKG